jgi:hypothetical protein
MAIACRIGGSDALLANDRHGPERQTIREDMSEIITRPVR